MRTFTVTFARIGRNHNVPPLEVKSALEADQAAADVLAEAVFRYARKFVKSKWFVVDADLSAGTGTIESSRFGEFTFVEHREATS